MARMKKLMIIGGGAAGLAAAIAAADVLRARGMAVGGTDAGDASCVDVVVCEADERVGRSILATGNGRCNFSNASVDAAVYRNGAFVGATLDALRDGGDGDAAGDLAAAGDPVHAFFAELGLLWREEGEGRLYPLANKATSVLEVLRAAAADAGVRERCDSEAVRIDAPAHPGDRFHVRFADGAVQHAEAVIVAVGGRASRGLVPACIPATEPRPVLGPLRTDTRLARALNNIRVRCAVSLTGPDGVTKACERGEVLFRDYGVSGIAVFNLSRFAEEGDTLVIDLLPQVEASEVEVLLAQRSARLRERGGTNTGDDVVRGMVLPAVGRAVLKAAGVPADRVLAARDVPALARALKGVTLAVRGVGEARQCQVHRGGCDVAAFDPRTCEARALPGLHVVGEALDVDAPCGGFNLHWAWASGLAAGRAAAARVAEGARRA